MLQQGQQQRAMPIDLKNAVDLKCDLCQNNLFVPVFFIKYLSALVSPSGQEMNLPIQTFACSKCGNVNKEFTP
jgi:hypothetical protein